MKNLLNHELTEMLNEKGNVCVSIIIPTHRIAPLRQEDPLKVKKSIAAAKALLDKKYKNSETFELKIAIDEIADEIDFVHQQDGIGIFVSKNVKKFVVFPFPVTEKIMVGDSFEIRDLVYKNNYSLPYFLLMLTENTARLFKGELNQMSEIKSSIFPKLFFDDYEYQKPSRGTSYGEALKSFEKDKSVLQEIRIRTFYKNTDKALKHYLENDKKFVIAGTKKAINLYERYTENKKNIIGHLTGNYEHISLGELAEKVWQGVESYIRKTTELDIKDFEEKIGKGYGVEGLKEVWKAAKEGKGLKLLVEKDFLKQGFLVDGEEKLYLSQPYKLEHRVLEDAVENIADTVLSKRGEVVFVENGMLQKHQGIAMITRY